MKKFFLFLFSIGMLSLALAGAAAFWGCAQYTKEGPLPEERLFTVQKGEGVSAIAAHLAAQGVIAQPYVFMAAVRLGGKEKSLKAGEYRFEKGASMQAVLKALESGDVFLRQFTIPEGLTSWQVVQILNDIPALSGEIATLPPEGSLLPETYSYVSGETRQDKIEQMQKAMDEALEQLWQERSSDAPVLTKKEAVILASIVEKETAVPGERARIAGVFINRLEKGMKLQTDPTVIYAITHGKIRNEGQGPLGRRLLSKDLQFESPYNTYKYPGLPPGPIANPGYESLKAVLNPEKHDFYYFVADGTGGHVFSASLREHNANADQWRKIRKEQKKP